MRGFRKIANPAVNTSLYPTVRISDSGFRFCPLQKQTVELWMSISVLGFGAGQLCWRSRPGYFEEVDTQSDIPCIR